VKKGKTKQKQRAKGAQKGKKKASAFLAYGERRDVVREGRDAAV
jgi:hypothetical protein